MSDLDIIIARIVRQIWERHDTDNSGALDRDEARRMLESTTCTSFGMSAKLDEAEFEATFAEIDANGDGVIDYREMVAMVKLTLGL